MKALILNASPRRGGLVTAMTSRIASALTDHGWETVTIDVSDCRIAPCRGCMACRSTGRCTLPDDDAQHILSLMRETDALIVGAPCYWGNMPGTLKLLFDRMVYGMMTTDRRGIPHGLLKGRLQIGRNDTSRRNTASQRHSAIRTTAPVRQNSTPSQPRVSSPMIRLSNPNALLGASSQKCSYCAALSTPAPGVSLTTRKQKNGTARNRHV